MMSIASTYNSSAGFDFIPKTFVFPQDENDFRLYQARNKHMVFIAKP